MLDAAVRRGDVPGVVAAVSDRAGHVHIAARGHARVADPHPMAEDAVFRIASMTKLVTTVAVLLLVEEGRVELDAPLAQYLPLYRQPEVLDHFDHATRTYTTRPAQRPVTIRQLLTHTSGYGYWFLDLPLKSLTTGEPELFDPPFLMSPPGAKFGYSISTDVLGQIIEPLTGMALDEFFARRIFEPLGMPDTSFRLPANTARLTSIFVKQADGYREKRLETLGPAPRGGGGLYSTARDYLRFLRLLLNGGVHEGRRLLSAETVAAMTRNQIGPLTAELQTTAFMARSNDFIFMNGTQRFGFGVTIETEDQPSGRSKGSYGWAGILNTYFWVDPQRELAATILMQVQPFADATCVEIYRRYEQAVYASLAA